MNFKNRKKSCEKAVETALDSFEKACGIWTHYDESVSTGQCQPVSVNRSVSTGQCQPVSVNWSVCSGLFPLWQEMQSRQARKEEQKDTEEETAKQWFYSWLYVFPNIWFCINSSQENESIEHYANVSNYTGRHWCNNVAVRKRDIETSAWTKHATF